MKRKPFIILRHAVTMARRNLRSYAMLSVTIILSFSLLLGFMVYMDTEHYNKTKETFALDRGLLTFSSSRLSPSRISQIQERTSQYGVTHSVQNLSIPISIHLSNAELTSGESLPTYLRARAYSLPQECWFLQRYSNSYRQELGNTVVKWLDDRTDTNISLKKGQILLDEQLFKALGGSTDNKLLLSFSFPGEDGAQIWTDTYTVVGTVPSNTSMDVTVKENPVTGEMEAHIDSDYESMIIFSLDDLNPNTHPSEQWHRSVVFHSTHPESVLQVIQSMESGLKVDAVFEWQDSALETMRREKQIKSVITIVMLLILGINLYSSFQNALNERKFEIGVKRAVGASAFSIVRQFFYESMLVMLADILITIVLVVDISLIFKLYREATYFSVLSEGYTRTIKSYMEYVLYITPYSMGMFAVCALVLTVVFSFIFAYKATRVQIVDYLKAE